MEAWKRTNERNLWYGRVISPFLSGWKWFLCWVIPSVLLADSTLNHENCFGSGEDGNEARFWGINSCHNNFASLFFFSSLNNALLSLFYFVDMWATHGAWVVPSKAHTHRKLENTLRHARTPTSNPPASEKPQVRDSCLKYIFFIHHHCCWIQSTARPQYSPSNLSCIIHVLRGCPCVPVHPLPS